MLKGHEGPISKIKYNREGDLLFTCARKDKKPCVWYADNGERLGNYEGHEGAVWNCDVNFDSTQLLTASADRTAKLWDVQSGKELYSFAHQSSVRTCGFAEGGRMILTAGDDNFGAPAAIYIYNIAEDIKDQTDEPVREMFAEGSGKQYSALWGGLNTYVIAAGEDGRIRKWNVETGQVEHEVQGHLKVIKDLKFNKDQSMFITASSDKTAKLFDSKTLECLKTYRSDRPLNAASISSCMNHVITAGGQDAMNVTVTSSKVGHFQVDFFHTVYQEYMGHVKGHFGPVNTVDFAPDGRSYASGSEDGYIRLHHFDKDYFNTKYQW
jgi:translation initiation factor 3 subunit I